MLDCLLLLYIGQGQSRSWKAAWHAREACQPASDNNPSHRAARKLFRSLNLTCRHADLAAALRLYSPVPVNWRVAKWYTALRYSGGQYLENPILCPRHCCQFQSICNAPTSGSVRHGCGNLSTRAMDKILPLSGDETTWQWRDLLFNGGPRTCPGTDFVLRGAMYTIARLIQHHPNIRLPHTELGSNDWYREARRKFGLFQCRRLSCANMSARALRGTASLTAERDRAVCASGGHSR